jgi:hypothetical protein
MWQMSVGGLICQLHMLYIPWLYPPVDYHEVCWSRILPASEWGKGSLGIDIYRGKDGSLSCKVPRKVTNTNQHLYARLYIP